MSAQPHFLYPVWPDLPPNVRALSTTRVGGYSRVPYDDGSGNGGFNLASHVGDEVVALAKNRALLQNALPSPVTFLSQIHGNIVVDAALAQEGVAADASFSTANGVVCAVLTADCLPVLLADRAGRVVAAVHAGWRGLAAGVVQAAVNKMRAAGAQEITAWLGPAISQDAFEVGAEVPAAFAREWKGTEHFFQPCSEAGKYLADLYGLARHLLGQLQVDSVHGGEYCTVIERAKFYSYRRDGVTGRMASLIWID